MNRSHSIGLLILAIGLPAAAQQMMSSHTSTGASAQPTANLHPAQRPVARVNGTVLTETDLLREEYTIFPYARQHNGSIPKEMEPQIRDGALKMIIFEELCYQDAVRQKMSVPPAKLDQAVKDFQDQFDSPQEYQSLLRSEFQGSEKLLREKVRRSLLIEEYLKAHVADKAVVTPAEVEAYYDRNPKQFEYPESFTFQTISVIPPTNATPQQLKEARQRAEDALRQAKATKNSEEFGMLAEKISEDDYRVMMGQHKPVSRKDLAPQVIKALEAMKVDEVSDLIQFEQAYTIIKLNAHTPAGKTKFEDVRAQLTKRLQQEKTNDIRAALDKRLKQNATVETL